jgi:DNA-binding IclR family transcriptional regulator
MIRMRLWVRLQVPATNKSRARVNASPFTQCHPVDRRLLRELKATTRRGFGLAMNEAEPAVTALATTIRSENGGGATLGTVSIAGPNLRMTNSHIHELAPPVIQSASELSKLWPLRPRSGRQVPAIDVAEAAVRHAAFA